MNFRSFMVSVAVGLLLLAAAWGGILVWNDYSEYRQFRRDEMNAEAKLERIEQQLKEQERKLERLKKDQAYVELMIRQRLWYAKPEEKVYRFEE